MRSRESSLTDPHQRSRFHGLASASGPDQVLDRLDQIQMSTFIPANTRPPLTQNAMNSGLASGRIVGSPRITTRS